MKTPDTISYRQICSATCSPGTYLYETVSCCQKDNCNNYSLPIGAVRSCYVSDKLNFAFSVLAIITYIVFYHLRVDIIMMMSAIRRLCPAIRQVIFVR